MHNVKMGRTHIAVPMPPEIEASEMYMSLYTNKPMTSASTYALKGHARASRLNGSHGVIVKISRDKNGDFTIDVEEEF